MEIFNFWCIIGHPYSIASHQSDNEFTDLLTLGNTKVVLGVPSILKFKEDQKI